jgi:nitrogen regulatory protein P-II 1
MKMIVAIIRPEKLSAVQAALNAQDVSLVTVSEVLGCGGDQSTTEIYRGREFRRPATKVRLEIAVHDSSSDTVVEAILAAGCSTGSGTAGDGMVFVMELGECTHIGRLGALRPAMG